MLAGAIKAGDQGAGKGITAIAAQGDIDIQAQSDTLQVAAQKDVTVQSQSTQVEIASPKKITIAVAGGASITIEGGNITTECPGTITIKASSKSFVAPARANYDPPKLPKVAFEAEPFELDLRITDQPGSHGLPMAHAQWQIVLLRAGRAFESVLFSGTTDDDGQINLDASQQERLSKLYMSRPNDVWIQTPHGLRELTVVREANDWSDDVRAAQAQAALDYADTPPWGLGAGSAKATEFVVQTDEGSGSHALWPQV